MTKAWLKDKKVKTLLITAAITVVSLIVSVLDED